MNQGTLRIIGKGSKERRVFLREDVLELIQRYLDELGESDCLFPSPRGGPITQNHIQIEMGKYARKAGLPEGVTAHTLRHTCATHYLIGGAPITFVQGLLGHASLNTTGLYTGLVDDVAREIAISVPLAMDTEEPERLPRYAQARRKISQAVRVLGSKAGGRPCHPGSGMAGRLKPEGAVPLPRER